MLKQEQQAYYSRPHSSRRTQKDLTNIFSPFVGNNISSKQKQISLHSLMNPIVQISEQKSKFQDQFLYGKTLKLFRKGKTKPVYIFIDTTYENLLWISTNSKAFIIDLSFTTVLFHFIQPTSMKNIEHKNCLTLIHFNEVYSFLFQKQEEIEFKRISNLFQRYEKWCKVYHAYPAYFSSILKIYAFQNTKNIQQFTVSQVLGTISTIGLRRNSQQARKILSECYKKYNNGAQLNTNSVISKEILDQFFQIMFCSDNLQQLFQKFASTKLKKEVDKLQKIMHKSQFLQFLQEIQGESEASIKQTSQRMSDKISFFDFCSILQNQKINYACLRNPTDEKRPLNQYFCYSSHNTYLTGNQLTSEAKVQRYVEDLLAGVKCVELDIHNNGNELMVAHAVKDITLGTFISFDEVIKAIDKVTDQIIGHWPIILSLQNHANERNRFKILECLTKVLNQKIYLYNPQQKNFPSLSYLKGKIIVKTSSSISSFSRTTNNKVGNSQDVSNIYKLPFNMQKQTVFEDSNFSKRYELFKNQRQIWEKEKYNFKGSFDTLKNIFLPIQPMAKVTTLFKAPQGYKSQNSGPFQCASINQVKIPKIPYQKIIDFSKRSWVRTYPDGLEIDSDNYDPCQMLNIGAQIIALNTQTKDDYAFILTSYFRAGIQNQNVKIGYVLKPDYLRFNIPKPTKMYKFTISIVQSYNNKLAFKFFGLTEDNKINKNTSGIIMTQNPNQSFIMIETESHERDCLPLRFIRKGYRLIILRNSKYVDSGKRALIKIDIECI